VFIRLKEKILLDTDIGSDIDDAVCLAYLLANPQCELLGITTVSGEAEKRAMLASALCKVAGKEVPIFPGCEDPFLVPQRQKTAGQSKALANWEHDKVFPKGQAIQFLRETIKEHPGEITLLTIGPLTNIAILFKTYPEIPSLLKRLVMMCGSFTNNYGPLEWNAIADPHAAAIVYNTDVPIHLSIGLDVTLQVTMHAEEVKEKFQHKLLRPVLDFAKVWFEHRDTITFHDPLAAVSIFDEGVCTFKKGNIGVDLHSDYLKGYTYWDEDEENGKKEVALEVDKERFFKEYFSVFK
jgi:purine nucleosidase